MAIQASRNISVLKEMAMLMLYGIELAALSYRFNDPYQKSDLHGSNITN